MSESGVTGARPAKLYSPALLALASELANFPLTAQLTHQAEARSRTCGSVVIMGIDQDEAGRITGIGMQVAACAIGQASAAVLARAAIGTRAGLITETLDGLEQWLAGAAPLPDWPGLDALAPAKDHPGRRGALLLPWTTACMALSSPAAAG